MNTDQIGEFENYLNREIKKAVTELGKFDDDVSRKHVQKLVFSSLVDRFDYMIDKTIIDNCREEKLARAALDLKEFKSRSMTENELLRMLIDGDDLQAVLDEKIKERLKKITGQRHSLKLAMLLELCTGGDPNALKKAPRVNPNTGEILNKYARQSSMPTGICGYADWLYCRRAGVVHGDGRYFTKRDVQKMKEVYDFDLPKTFRIELSSIKIASKFYIQVCELIKA